MTTANQWDRAQLTEVAGEIESARNQHANMHSPHEAYSVIKEELDEFWDEVRKKDHDKGRMANELTQIAAMAVRAVVDLDLRYGDE